MITKLPHTGWLYIYGADAFKFLQGQITCDLNELTQSNTFLAAHCNPKGRIISLFRIFRFEDGFLLNLPEDMVSIAVKNFSKYIVFFKASIETVSDDIYAVGLMDEAKADAISLEDEFKRSIYISREPQSSESNQRDWHIMDIKVGLPMVYAHSSEKYLPHYINLQKLGGVSFKKGCYTGQEIIARMQHRGALKYHMVYQASAAKVEDAVDAVDAVDAAEAENQTWHNLIIIKKD